MTRARVSWSAQVAPVQAPGAPQMIRARVFRSAQVSPARTPGAPG
jgi:hypothetical protein